MHKPPVPINLYFLSSLIVFMLWLASSHAHAAASNFPLTPYEARYTIEWHGVNAGTATTSLQQNKDRSFTVESQTQPRFKWVPIRFAERSRFSWKNNEIQPLQYDYDLKEARKHKKGTVHFDWENKRVSNTIGQEPWEQAMPPHILDKLTHTLKLRSQLLAKTNEPLVFMVAEDDEIQPYHFKFIANERLKTKLGWLDTVKISHKSRSGKESTMWLAELFEYAPVKVEQYKNGSAFARGEIISYRKLS